MPGPEFDRLGFRNHRRPRKLQRRYWEGTLRDENDFARHVDYIHYNPVKHGHVRSVHDWPFSSFHRIVRLWICPRDWAGVAEDKGTFGEL
jgi:putative transposase